MSKYPRPVVASKYGNRPLIEVPAVSIPRLNRSAGDVPTIAPVQYSHPPYSAQQQPTYINQTSYPTLQQTYVPQQRYVSPVPVPLPQQQYVPPAPVPLPQQQYVPPAPVPLPQQQYNPPVVKQPRQQTRNWSNIATNSNLVPYVETVQIPQTHPSYGAAMPPNLPNYNVEQGQNMPQYGAPLGPNYGAPIMPNYGINVPVNNHQNGFVDSKGEVHHFYGPNGSTQTVPRNLSHMLGGNFQQSIPPTNFVLQGTVEYGKLTSVRLKESTISFNDIPQVLLNEIYRVYKEVPKTKIKVIASRGEYNIYATPYLNDLVDTKHEGYVYEPHERYHEYYDRKPIGRPVDRYTKRYDRSDVRLATERRNVLESDEDDDATSYPVGDNDAKRRWRKLKHAIKVRQY